MFCKQCGQEVADDATFCGHCGCNLKSTETTIPNEIELNISPKSRLVALLLAFFVGGLGIHNFYLGKKSVGITQLILTITIIGAFVTSIWVLVDLIMIIVGSAKDNDGRLVKKWSE